ncbi:hypothetical protein JTE90_010399 [Oedothorax gibbosus]|uniref:Protein sleepless n=1 Tax=Oedothorax gibbosus TaxID=931172 RepID=A0AAV6W2G3_9ARAC|nr:hypothetical protein JTE90_010399 [Oedothorax gibbosus]
MSPLKNIRKQTSTRKIRSLTKTLVWVVFGHLVTQYLLNSILILRRAAVVCFVELLVLTEQGRIKRCFNCRSRGDLGDCKDPFPFNSTTVEGLRAVEALPCASGWCAKVVEGKGDDYAIATERMCLQRPPGDEEQRCAPTLFQGRRVLMCFCKGDLCNTSVRSCAFSLQLFLSCLFLTFVQKLWL